MCPEPLVIHVLTRGVENKVLLTILSADPWLTFVLGAVDLAKTVVRHVKLRE
jgi:hypothetical protein